MERALEKSFSANAASTALAIESRTATHAVRPTRHSSWAPQILRSGCFPWYMHYTAWHIDH